MRVSEQDYLVHFGVLGMKWGRRQSESGGDDSPSKSTVRMAKKDAQRYVDAKMFYGETAGTKRKLLKAELDKKKKTIPGYEKAFNEHVAKVDAAKAAKKAVRKRVSIDTVTNGRRFVKKALNITGPITIALASALYLRNKDKVDSFVSKQGRNIIDYAKSGKWRNTPKGPPIAVPNWPRG